MIANAIVLLSIVGCAAYLYLKSTFVQAFGTIIVSICSIIVGLAYFEFVAVQLHRVEAMVPYAQPISFGLIFIIVFAILQTVLGQIAKKPAQLAVLPERIGRVVCGLILGLIIGGTVLIVLIMAPLPASFPYARFETSASNVDEPAKAVLNADGFAAGWFTSASKGSLSGKTSFAAVHPDFLSQAFLNRLALSGAVRAVTDKDAITVPRNTSGDEPTFGAWQASANVKTADGKAAPTKAGHDLVIVRVGLNRKSAATAGYFTPSQMRLICKPSDEAQSPMIGRATNSWPIGYMKAQDQLELKRLSDQIAVSSAEFGSSKVKYIDVAFQVPSDSVPVLLEFKQNAIVEVPKPVSADQAPPVIPFGKDDKDDDDDNDDNDNN